MPEILSPFVYWAQTESNVTLKVELKDVKNPDVTLLDKNLQFTAKGHGAKGPHNYGFSLNFHSAIDPEGSQFKVSERQVDFILKKKDSGWWPRLTGTPQKPVWLKIDFDRWKSEDDLDDEEPRDVMGDYPGLYDRLEKEELGYRKEDMRKVYLVFYNLAQFIGFMYILTVMAVRYSRDGPDSMEGTYQAVGGAVKFCHLMQILEIMHPLFGYTKGGVLVPFLQIDAFTVRTTRLPAISCGTCSFVEHANGVAMGSPLLPVVANVFMEHFEEEAVSSAYIKPMIWWSQQGPESDQNLLDSHSLSNYTRMKVGGRNFILFCMIEAEPRIADKPVVFYLFFVWSLVEIIRYPYYIAQLYKKNIGLLTWLRYTIWIPLYPLGFLCEGVVILRNIPYFEETQRFTVTLPNSWNFAFHFPSLLRIYLLFLFFPGMYMMMSHMYKARIQKLGPKKWRSKFD